jgi:hypothetical protein
MRAVTSCERNMLPRVSVGRSLLFLNETPTGIDSPALSVLKPFQVIRHQLIFQGCANASLGCVF